MSDLEAVRAEIARQLAIEAKATPESWGHGKGLSVFAPEHRIYRDTRVLAYVDRERNNSDSDFEEIATARNAHRDLLDIAKEAAEIIEAFEYCGVIRFTELRALLKRLVEGK